jgi:hypothetical protein
MMLFRNALAAPNQVLQRVPTLGMTHIMLLTTLCKVGHGVNIFNIIMSNATVMSQMLIVDSAIVHNLRQGYHEGTLLQKVRFLSTHPLSGL